jgi:hypothetical protein
VLGSTREKDGVEELLAAGVAAALLEAGVAEVPLAVTVAKALVLSPAITASAVKMRKIWGRIARYEADFILSSLPHLPTKSDVLPSLAPHDSLRFVSALPDDNAIRGPLPRRFGPKIHINESG